MERHVIPSSCNPKISLGNNSLLYLWTKVPLFEFCSFLKILAGHEYLTIVWILTRFFLVSHAPINNGIKVVVLIIVAYNLHSLVNHKY